MLTLVGQLHSVVAQVTIAAFSDATQRSIIYLF